MENILNTILKNTYTLSQFRKRLKLIDSYFQQKFFQGLGEPLTAEDAQWFNSLPKSFSDNFTKDNLSEIINKLTETINTMPILTIFLTFEANDKILDQIGPKVRTTFGNNFLIDIKYNPNLIAGCALSWKGIYKDYSLQAIIEERKLAILQSFKKFLR